MFNNRASVSRDRPVEGLHRFSAPRWHSSKWQANEAAGQRRWTQIDPRGRQQADSDQNAKIRHCLCLAIVGIRHDDQVGGQARQLAPATQPDSVAFKTMDAHDAVEAGLCPFALLEACVGAIVRHDRAQGDHPQRDRHADEPQPRRGRHAEEPQRGRQVNEPRCALQGL